MDFQYSLRGWIPWITSTGSRLLKGDPVLVTANNYDEDADLSGGSSSIPLGDTDSLSPYNNSHGYSNNNSSGSSSSTSSCSSATMTGLDKTTTTTTNEMIITVTTCRSDAYHDQRAPRSTVKLPRRAPSALRTFHELLVGMKSMREFSQLLFYLHHWFLIRLIRCLLQQQV